MTLFILVLSFLFAVAIFLTVQFSIFIPSVNGIPILMYHQVKPQINTRLCISPDKLETQLTYLINNGYSCVKLGELTNNKNAFPKRSFVLTFDDAYLNNLEYLYPLLVKYNLHATIMLPVKYLGKENEWDGSGEKIMTTSQLKSMSQEYVSFGLHTYNHKNLRHATPEEIKSEIRDSSNFLTENSIAFLPVLAYPYGGFPREKEQLEAFYTVLENNGIKLGIRIGNRINRWPLKNVFLVKRIDIRGIDSMWDFKTKIKKGRVKMF